MSEREPSWNWMTTIMFGIVGVISGSIFGIKIALLIAASFILLSLIVEE